MIKISDLNNSFSLPERVFEQALEDSFLRRMVRLVKERQFFQALHPLDPLSKEKREESVSKAQTINFRYLERPNIISHFQSAGWLKGDLRISKKIAGISNSLTITKEGFCAIDSGKRLGSGNFAKVKSCITTDGLECVRRIYTRLGDMSVISRELNTFRMFGSTPGIVKTLSFAVYLNKFEQLKIVTFHPRYAGTFQSLLERKTDLSEAQKLVITLQLLIGLKNIADKGLHNDLNSGNILVRPRNGHYEIVISDLGDWFYTHQEMLDFQKSCREFFKEEEIEAAPELVIPECFKTLKDLTKADVWRMGLQLCRLFGKEDRVPGDRIKKRSINLELKEMREQISSYLSKTPFPEGIRFLLKQMIVMSPTNRWSAAQCLDYFRLQFVDINIEEIFKTN